MKVAPVTNELNDWEPPQWLVMSQVMVWVHTVGMKKLAHAKACGPLFPFWQNGLPLLSFYLFSPPYRDYHDYRDDYHDSYVDYHDYHDDYCDSDYDYHYDNHD